MNTALMCGLQVGRRAAVEPPLSPEASDFIGVGKRSHVQREVPGKTGSVQRGSNVSPWPWSLIRTVIQTVPT